MGQRTRIFRTIGLWIAAAAILHADDPTLAVNKIPAELRKGAKAVVRRHVETFEASKGGGGTLTVQRAITVLDASARSRGNINVWYDSFTSVEDMEATILDANGEEVSELKRSEISDHAGFDGFSLAEEVRVKSAQITHSQIPYTIVIEYELDLEGSFGWPEWTVHQTRDPVELARFEVRTSGDHALRWWCNQDSVRPRVTADDDDSVYVWEYRNLPALPAEEGWDDWDDATIVVRIAPNEFTMEGRAGSSGSWSELGSWFQALYADRQQLPPDAVRLAQAAVGNASTTEEKIERIYRYMQGRTRYVSIQLGLGSWQPFPAATVHEKGYGDCKALANYMIALLDAVGIRAYPVTLYSGYVRRPFIEEFPSNQFNHVIACVPMERDTVWLECTSQTISPGRLGGSSEGRQALLLSPEGGRVIRLPGSRAEENRLTRTAVVNVESSGAMSADVRATFTGNQHDRFRGYWENLSADERSRSILGECGMSEASLRSLLVDSSKSGRAEATVTFSAQVSNYGSKTGQRLFIPVEPFERRATTPTSVERRLSPVNLRYRYLDVDTVLIRLPEGYLVETMPKAVGRDASFAHFSSSVTRLANGDVQLIRSVSVTEPVVPAERYGEYRTFFQDVARADRAQIVLVRAPRQ